MTTEPRPVGDRLRGLVLAVAAVVGVATLLVMAPLLAGEFAGRPHVLKVAVVDLHAQQQIDDEQLGAELRDNAGSDAFVVVLPAADRLNSALTVCKRSPLPKSCAALHDVKDRETEIPTWADGIPAPRGFDEDTDQSTYVQRHDLPSGGDDFGWGAAIKVGLIMIVAGAGSLGWALRRRRPSAAPAPQHRDNTMPTSTPAPPPPPLATAPRSSRSGAPAPRDGVTRAAPASPPRSPPPARPSAPAPAPAPLPLPDDVLAAVPGTVVAVTRFGAHGGFVDAGGVVVWASLSTAGGQVHPGCPLTVLSSSHERDALIVSLSVTQEVRP